MHAPRPLLGVAGALVVGAAAGLALDRGPGPLAGLCGAAVGAPALSAGALALGVACALGLLRRREALRASLPWACAALAGLACARVQAELTRYPPAD